MTVFTEWRSISSRADCFRLDPTDPRCIVPDNDREKTAVLHFWRLNMTPDFALPQTVPDSSPGMIMFVTIAQAQLALPVCQNFSEEVLSSPEPVIYNHGHALYKRLFKTFPENLVPRDLRVRITVKREVGGKHKSKRRPL